MWGHLVALEHPTDDKQNIVILFIKDEQHHTIASLFRGSKFTMFQDWKLIDWATSYRDQLTGHSRVISVGGFQKVAQVA